MQILYYRPLLVNTIGIVRSIVGRGPILSLSLSQFQNDLSKRGINCWHQSMPQQQWQRKYSIVRLTEVSILFLHIRYIVVSVYTSFASL